MQEQSSEARTRVLDAAEQLFALRGYTAVTLRDVAAAVGIRHASLYHHVPGGKQRMYVEVTERTLARHRHGLLHALTGAGPAIRTKLYAVADWLLDQPPMDFVRMMYSDMPALEPSEAARLSQLAFDSLLGPIAATLNHAHAAGELADRDMDQMAGGLLGMITSLHAVPLEQAGAAAGAERRAIAYALIDALLEGLLRRH